MKTKTSELTDAALDWAVARADNTSVELRVSGLIRGSRFAPFFNQRWNPNECWERYTPSTNWSQGGPIIHHMCVGFSMNMEPEHGDATRWRASGYRTNHRADGPTHLIAAMRCFVTWKLGDEIDIPKELHHG